MLKYTYVFAYYLFADSDTPPPSPDLAAHAHNTHRHAKGAAKDLFEMLQEDLGKTTDKLLEVIDLLLRRTDTEISATKLDAINHANLARKKRENLLNAVTRDPLFAAYLD